MNVQAAPPPYTPVGGSHMPSGSPPVLGSQMPGTTGGLPALSGLSPAQNPMAEQLQSMGRDEDTMLVHMTPGEVNSLQGLAMAAGGSLTINPHTGLPEAGFLKKLLPMLAGVGLNFILPGSGLVAALGGKAATAGLLTAAGSTALTGDLNKGLMAGLQAFGGASLAGGLQGALGGAAKGAASSAGAPVSPELLGQGSLAKPIGVELGSVATPTGSLQLASFPGAVAQPAATAAAQTAASTPGFLSQFGQAAKGTMTGLGAKAAPMAAGMGVLSSISDATAPRMPKYKEEKFNYVPMRMGRRDVRFQTPEQMRASGGAEFSYFTPTNPEPEPVYGMRGYAGGGDVSSQEDNFRGIVDMYSLQNPGAITASMYPLPSAAAPPPAPAMSPAPSRGSETMHEFDRPKNPQSAAGGLGTERPGIPSSTFSRILRQRQMFSAPGQRPALSMFPMRGVQDANMFAEGGTVDMRDGSFVVDARTVSELGNGSSNAGIDLLSRMGGRPVRGPGDGVSDSVKASIGGKQEARVARDEVIFPPEAVRRIGGGDEKRGTKKLYAMMDKAHKARKKAGRGQDTGLRRGLA